MGDLECIPSLKYKNKILLLAGRLPRVGRSESHGCENIQTRLKVVVGIDKYERKSEDKIE